MMLMEIEQYMRDIGVRARQASRTMATADTATKNRALLAMREALAGAREELMAANARDMSRGEANGLDAPLLDRLELTPERIEAMLEGLKISWAL